MLDALLHPKSIAVVGVSVDPAKVGHQIFANLTTFKGPVYPIHPTAHKVLGRSVFPDILSVPEQIDLVVIATPFATVEDIVHQCIDKKVKAIIIIAAGFAETSKRGLQIQDRIARRCKANHIALLGPNTLGAINPSAHLNASFAPSDVAKGSIGLISQSGAMLTTIFAEFASRSVGCSFALSLGNSAGVDVADALSYALNDPHTRVIALYVESITHIPEFFVLAKQVSAHKPIILLKGGLTSEGQRASLSHTAALATDSTLLRQAQHQFGFTFVETIEQFFETTFFIDQLLGKSHSKLPSNMMILTNAGGPGVNSVDVASKAGLELASWSGGATARFSRLLPRIKPANPTDLLGDATVTDIEHALSMAQEDPLIDAIVLIITPQAVTDVSGIVRMLIRQQKDQSLPHKPLVVSLMGGELQRPHIQKLRAADICAVEYANEAVEILVYTNRARRAQLVDRSEKIMRELTQALAPQAPEISRRTTPLRSNRLQEVYLLLEAYGFVLPRCAIVSDVHELDQLDTLDPTRVYPLIAKTANLNLKHKAVLGAVIGDIADKNSAIAAYKKLSGFGTDVLYQEVIEDAIEVIIGCKRDPIYGPFIAVGMGGSLANILADRSYIFVPASLREVRAALRRTKLYDQLTSEQRSLVLLNLERFIQLFTQHPEIGELEINPLMVTAHESYVADVKVTLV